MMLKKEDENPEAERIQKIKWKKRKTTRRIIEAQVMLLDAEKAAGLCFKVGLSHFQAYKRTINATEKVVFERLGKG